MSAEQLPPTDFELPIEVPTPPPAVGPGPLHGVRVVEIAHPFTAFAGRLLADAGADVVLIEPSDGADQRYHGPFAEDHPHIEMSLAWWAENAGKRSVVADLDTGTGRQFFRRIVGSADVLLEAEEPGRLARLGIDYPDLAGRPIGGGSRPSAGPSPVNDGLIQVAITPFGRGRVGDGAAAGGAASAMTDLTLMARGGLLWSCGYDDHELPPVRGRGNQAIRIAAHFAVMSTLTALVARSRHGGQFVDVSMMAAANVTTESASYSWLAAQQTVQRQTGRPAAPEPSEPSQFRCADGRYVHIGRMPSTPAEFTALRSWLDELGLAEEFASTAVLERGMQQERLDQQVHADDGPSGDVVRGGRDAMAFIAGRLTAHEAFVGFQKRGLAAGVVWSPDEMMTDPHLVERGFTAEIYQPQLDRTVRYPGPPIRFTSSPMGVRNPAPTLGEHSAEVAQELD